MFDIAEGSATIVEQSLCFVKETRGAGMFPTGDAAHFVIAAVVFAVGTGSAAREISTLGLYRGT